MSKALSSLFLLMSLGSYTQGTMSSDGRIVLERSRWAVMKPGSDSMACQDLQTDVKRSTDLGGSHDRMARMTSEGR